MAHHYSPKLFFVPVIILGLNILDLIFTLIILDHEFTPVASSVIDVYGDRFWVWKYGIVSACLLLLCLHSKFKRVETLILVTGSFYVGVVLYQLFLVTCCLP